MGQRSVLKFLKQQYRKDKNMYFTANDIDVALGVTTSAVSLKKLRYHNEVEYQKRDRPARGGKETFVYRHKSYKTDMLVIALLSE
ncbi:MAG: hypothetical protein V1818_01805 [Candidatus Aenigmatarchaeota archaeon]